MTAQVYKTDSLPGQEQKQELFIRRLGEILKEKRTEAVLAAMDIQNFKSVNEIWGMNNGNRLLSIIVDQSLKALGGGESVSRFFKDRFYLLLLGPVNTIKERLEAMRRQIEAEFVRCIGYPYSLVVSLGLCEYNDDVKSGDEWLIRANYALESAELPVGDGFAIYDNAMQENLQEVRKIEKRMQFGIENNEFRIYLQPQFELATGRLCGAEALVRWISPETGLVSCPDYFIPLFEKNGFIKKLDLYMMEQTCRVLRDWKKQTLEPVPIAVNISRRHIGEPGLAKRLLEICEAYGVPPEYIEIEMTETFELAENKTLQKALITLKKVGFSLALDDFGKENTSISLLRESCFDVIKFDKSFLSGCTEDKRARGLLDSMLQMVKNLGIKTHVEGIERWEEEDLLKTYQCDRVQGFYYAKPMPADMLTNYLPKT